MKTIADTITHLDYVDGIMIGREAYSNPFILSEVDEKIYGDTPFTLNRHQVVRAMYDYIEDEMSQGANFWHIARHMLVIFQGQPGARGFRRHLSENGHGKTADLSVMDKALSFVPEI